MNGKAGGPYNPSHIVVGSDPDPDAICSSGTFVGVDHGNDTSRRGHVDVPGIVDKHPVLCTEGVPFEHQHGDPSGWANVDLPSSTVLQAGHNHHSG